MTQVRPSAAPRPLPHPATTLTAPLSAPSLPKPFALTRHNPLPRQYGGALYNFYDNYNYNYNYTYYGNITLNNCTLSSNRADVRPPAAPPPPPRPPRPATSPTAPLSAPSLPKTVALTRRTPPPRQTGGALYTYRGTTTLSGCTLSSNRAQVRPAAASPPPAASCDEPHRPALRPVPPKYRCADAAQSSSSTGWRRHRKLQRHHHAERLRALEQRGLSGAARRRATAPRRILRRPHRPALGPIPRQTVVLTRRNPPPLDRVAAPFSTSKAPPR